MSFLNPGEEPPQHFNCKCQPPTFEQIFGVQMHPMKCLREVESYIHSHLGVPRSEQSARLVIWVAKRLMRGSIVIINRDKLPQ